MKKAVFFISLCLLFISVLAKDSAQVSFNMSNGKYHRVECRWAIRCTKSCEIVPLDSALAWGGIPCKVCRPPKNKNRNFE